MSDPRIQTVVNTLVEHGHNSTSDGLTTDDLATAIVNALDREHGEHDEGEDTGELSAEEVAAAGTQPNPETPAGTGTEGGAGDPAS
ncbi:MAG TPA: hypothetical protein VFO15_18035 [Xanthobacteraceae bacterium]|nr:hypothetical protein [Xanthobacteraceae bacterium]